MMEMEGRGEKIDRSSLIRRPHWRTRVCFLPAELGRSLSVSPLAHERPIITLGIEGGDWL